MKAETNQKMADELQRVWTENRRPRRECDERTRCEHDRAEAMRVAEEEHRVEERKKATEEIENRKREQERKKRLERWAVLCGGERKHDQTDEGNVQI